MRVLVCGGAGYIGSHAVVELLEKGYEVVVADNLETGHREAVWSGAELVVGDLRNPDFCQRLLAERPVDAVIDFAAYSLVGESVTAPLKYYRNNLYGTMNLLDAMEKQGVGYIVFSSTAATYGEPKHIPIREEDLTLPTNPYGETKLAVEKMLKWTSGANGLHYAALRYFNVAGAHPSGKIGENHNPETHLIPNMLKSAMDESKVLSIFGDDYDTPDGTCVRDYIHVSDLADAHVLALEKIMASNENQTYNLGNGRGFSNMEILETARKVTGKPIPCRIAPRRQGDPSTLVASSEKITRELGWTPKYNQLEKIIETAYRWTQKLSGSL